MPLSKSDFQDVALVDSTELLSDGYLLFKTILVTSTTSSTKTVIVEPEADYLGLLYDQDAPVSTLDRVYITGTSGSNGDGYFTVNTIISNSAFTVFENIGDSIGGEVNFLYPPGAESIGFDSSGLNITSAKNLQDAIKDIATEVENVSGGGLTEEQHKILRQLIHFIDEGPAEGFASGAYREVLPVAAIFPTQVIWWESSSKLKKIVTEDAALNANQTPSAITWQVYDVDGSTVLATITDTIAYSGIIELNRARTINVSGSSSNSFTESSHRTLRQLIHFINEGPAEGFASGAYREILPSGDPFPTSIIWWESSAKLKKIVEKTITRNANKMPSITEWKMYNTDGTSVLSTVTDTHTYSGIFETSRTRSIA